MWQRIVCAIGVGLSLALAATAGTAFAGSSGNDWTGAYIGINGGFGFGQNQWDETGNNDHTATGSLNGALIGATLGLNYQRQDLLFGVESDFDWTSLKSSNGHGNPFNCGKGSTCDTSLDWLSTARARLGYDLTAQTLIYATGGLAVGNVRARVPGTAPDPLSLDTQVGWTVGGGFEYALSQNVTAKLEGDFIDLGSASIGLGCDCTTRVQFGIAKIGLNYKF